MASETKGGKVILRFTLLQVHIQDTAKDCGKKSCNVLQLHCKTYILLTYITVWAVIFCLHHFSCLSLYHDERCISVEEFQILAPSLYFKRWPNQSQGLKFSQNTVYPEKDTHLSFQKTTFRNFLLKESNMIGSLQRHKPRSAFPQSHGSCAEYLHARCFVEMHTSECCAVSKFVKIYLLSSHKTYWL